MIVLPFGKKWDRAYSSACNLQIMPEQALADSDADAQPESPRASHCSYILKVVL
jgi:hypothetical protein